MTSHLTGALLRRRFCGTFEEGQQVRIDLILMRRREAVWRTRIRSMRTYWPSSKVPQKRRRNGAPVKPEVIFEVST